MTTSYGETRALVSTEGGVYLVSLTAGARGPLEVPSDARWMGLGAGDRILYADRAGTLYVADEPEGPFARIGEAPGAETFDSAGKYVVAGSSWDDVFLSADGGATWFARSVGEGLRIEDVVVRSDGVVVAQARRVVDDRIQGDPQSFIARPKKPFKKAPLQPSEFYKVGAWIWALAECPTILSADGERFVRENVYAVEDIDRWMDALQLSANSRADVLSQREIVTATKPPAPKYESFMDPQRGPCTGAGSGAPPESDEPKPKGKSALVLHAKPLPIRPSAVSILADGICREENRCTPGTPFSSQPHAVRRERPALFNVPKECAQPFGVKNAPGLPLLFCFGHGRTHVFALDADNKWQKEGTLADPVSELGPLTAASDGTILVPGTCQKNNTCRVWVRNPKPAGEAAAWRAVSDSFSVFVPVRGGNVLILRKEADGLFTFFLADEKGGRKKVAQGIDIPPDTTWASVMGVNIVFERTAGPKQHGVLFENQRIEWSD